jgi:hypothetical protein
LVADCHVLIFFGLWFQKIVDAVGIDDALVVFWLISTEIFHLELDVVRFDFAGLLDLLGTGAVIWTADALHVGGVGYLRDGFGGWGCDHNCFVDLIE